MPLTTVLIIVMVIITVINDFVDNYLTGTFLYICISVYAHKKYSCHVYTHLKYNFFTNFELFLHVCGRLGMSLH